MMLLTILRNSKVYSRSFTSSIHYKVIDLRSDTVTKPCSAMRKAIATAEVGDDVFGDDPTVIALEKHVAELLGKESALFVCSGTMGNAVSLAAHCGRGDEIIIGKQSHIFLYEAGGSSALFGIHSNTIENNKEDGTIPIEDIKNQIRVDDPHYPTTTLIAIENTQNKCGGLCLPDKYIDSLSVLAKEHSLNIHMDGARFMNAAVKNNSKTPAEMLVGVKTISLCLSKGLGSPFGSVVAGDDKFIYRARRARKMVGGGLRQAGMYAAAGLYALENNIERLAEDHSHASLLATELNKLEGLYIATMPETNIVCLGIDSNIISVDKLINELEVRNVNVRCSYTSSFIRLVTHKDVSLEDIELVIHYVKDLTQSGKLAP